MNGFHPQSPQQVCESLIQAEKSSNAKHSILPSEIEVADRLLARGVELRDAYQELHDKLHAHPPALQVFIGLILEAAAFWNPEKIQEASSACHELANVNQKIAEKAAELSTLLEERTKLHDWSGFRSGTYYHVCDVIDAASRDNSRFKHVQTKLMSLRGQYDLKYWPSLSQFMQEIAINAEMADVVATDPMTEAATATGRKSNASFFKALFESMKENSVENFGKLPRNFKLTDQTLATLASCALGLGPDDLITDQFVKRFRQRERDRDKK